MLAMETLGVSQAQQTELLKVLSGLLILGNITFEQDDNDEAHVSSSAELTACETQLGATNMSANLTSKLMQRGGGGKRASVYTIEYNKMQAESARNALIKSVYTHLFDWVVEQVNSFISGSKAAASLPYVGLLDIFGFENFKFNSFEQVRLSRHRHCRISCHRRISLHRHRRISTTAF